MGLISSLILCVVLLNVDGVESGLKNKPIFASTERKTKSESEANNCHEKRQREIDGLIPLRREGGREEGRKEGGKEGRKEINK